MNLDYCLILGVCTDSFELSLILANIGLIRVKHKQKVYQTLFVDLRSRQYL
jgi:hypothetical protein